MDSKQEEKRNKVAMPRAAKEISPGQERKEDKEKEEERKVK